MIGRGKRGEREEEWVGGLMIRLEKEAKERREIRERERERERERDKEKEKERKQSANGGCIRIHLP
jgi:hypothetical protein